MRDVLIVGVGGVGGYFGACLVRAGRGVRFVARGANLERLRATGLRVETDAGDFATGPVEASDEAAPADLVLVCVKRPDTRAALAPLRGRLAADAVVLSLQNGLDAAEDVEAILGLGPQPRAVVYLGAELIAPGLVHHATEGRILVGEPDGRASARLEALVETLRVPGFGVETTAVIDELRWKKLAWNSAFNLLCAVSGRETAGIVARPEGLDLVRGVLAEVVAVARATGVAIEEDWIERMIAATLRKLRSVRPSTLQDRERGRPLEHEALTGTVVRRGEALGVATPISRTLDRLAALLSPRAS